MAFRGATLAALVLALCAAAPRAVLGAASCPSSGSSGSISCYTGMTFSATLPSTGGLCTCACGTSSMQFDYDYASNTGGLNLGTTQFVAASTSACSNTLCSTKFATACPASAFVNATYYTWAQYSAAKAPVSTSIGSDTICTITTQTCSASSPCNTITTGTTTTYDSLTGLPSMNAAGQCGLLLAAGGSTVTNLCNTNNCNTVGSGSSSGGSSSAAPAALSGAKAAAAAAAVAALAVAAM